MLESVGFTVLSYMLMAAQLALGVVFIFSSLPKLLHPLVFVRSVAEYRVLPARLARGFAFALIPLEVFVAIALLTSRWTTFALPVAALMLCTFLIGTTINLRRGREVPCGCFGSSSERISLRTAARLVVLLVSVLVLIGSEKFVGVQMINLDRAITNPSQFVDLVETVLLSVFLFLITSWALSLPEIYSLVAALRQTQPATQTDASDKRLEAI